MIQRAKRLNEYLGPHDAPAEKGWLCDYCQFKELCENE